ncbi:N-acetylmuramoyl-L-alanine amidase [bacterium]|nr:N-acetylmuramoyl-L-alanine amidase [bacterium]
MQRIIIHWTGGTYTPNSVDLEHYHYIVDRNGKVHAGKYKPEDNENCADGKYAQHTGGGNTGSIGVAMACMYGFKDRKNVGKYPMTSIQFEACMKKVAELCKEHFILICPDMVMTHYEFGQKHPKTTSAGKIDIVFIPPYSHIEKENIGKFIRSKVLWYFHKLYS